MTETEITLSVGTTRGWFDARQGSPTAFNEGWLGEAIARLGCHRDGIKVSDYHAFWSGSDRDNVTVTCRFDTAAEAVLAKLRWDGE